MTLPTAYGVLRGIACSHLQTRSKSPKAASATVLHPSWLMLQLTKTLSGLTSTRSWRSAKKYPYDNLLDKGRSTKVHPVFAVKLSYRLADLSQNFHPPFRRELGIALD